MLGVGLSLTGRLRSSVFSPASLFRASEPGVWYDPSDLTTLFQNTAGTTPVTAAGQPVGLVLDKSKGLVLGPELVTNGDFSDGLTGWTDASTAPSTVSVVDGSLQLVSDGATRARARSSQTTVVGRTYRVTFIVLSGTVEFNCGTTIAGTEYFGGGTFSVGTHTRLVLATSTTMHLQIHKGVAGTGVADNISVREIAGNHATQSILASRPTYGIVPRTGRRNLLERTEEFDSAAWSRGNLITTGMANVAIAPDGTTTADKLIPDTANTTKFANGSPNYTASTGQAVTYSCYVKADGYSKIALRESAVTGAYASFDLSTASLIETGNAGSIVVSNATITSVGSGWFRIAMTCTNASGSQSNGFGAWPLSPSYTTGQPQGQNWAGNGTSGILIWGAQLEVGSTATNYQRVGSAFDVTEAGVPSLHYLSFDGVDDFLVTPTITPGVDKVQVFAGVRKLSDAAFGMIAELSTSDTNNGSLYAGVPTLFGRYEFMSRGTVRQFATSANNSSIAPITNVLTGLGDISGDLATLRVNGTQVAQSTADQGTGNYATAQMWIGRRGGATLPFNGHLYSLIVRFSTANLDASIISQTERWVGGKTGVTI